MRKFFIRSFQISRQNKQMLAMVIDTLLVSFSYVMALLLSYEVQISIHDNHYWLGLLGVTFVTTAIFYRLGVYRAVIRFSTDHIIVKIGLGCIASAFCLFIFFVYLNMQVKMSLLLIFTSVSIVTVCGARFIITTLLYYLEFSKREPVLIYGAGSSGRQLANSLYHSSEYWPVAFIDDNESIHGSTIVGIRVYSKHKVEEIIYKYKATKLLLAIPSASHAQRSHLISNLEPLPISIKTIPGLTDVIEGNTSLISFQDIAIEDLLGRDAVEPDTNLMSRNISGQRVLVTGSGGSIGSELCRQIIKLSPKQLVLFDVSEFNLYKIERELIETIERLNYQTVLTPIIGSIQNQLHIEKTMELFEIETVYHAAAYKHVPLVEYNIIEGIRNNVLGTLNTAKAAINVGVKTFVLISTDKAVRPTNVMGASKRLAELILQGLSTLEHETRFCMVRFGNVLGSSGSVVPLFRKQIKKGGPITLTHKEITRYFMTIPEAAELVLQAGAMGSGGDVFVLDMGESVKIIELAEKMVHLSGLTVRSAQEPNGDIEIQCTGLRPGEKLFEELLIGSNVAGTEHKRIMSAQEEMMSWDLLEEQLEKLEDCCTTYSDEGVLEILMSLPLNFKPSDENNDLMCKAKQ